MDFLFNINVQFFIAAYLIGGIPFGLVIAKKFAGLDILKSGSKSIGATNVLRVVKERDPSLAKKLGIATLLLDAVKGVLVMTVAYLVGVSEATLWGIAVIAVVGHCFSVYLNFEGGKGVATGMGVVMFMLPVETLIALGVWAIGAKVIKISSLSSLTALLSLVVASYFIHPDMAHAPLLIIAFIIFYKHIPNLIRLFQGEEAKVV